MKAISIRQPWAWAIIHAGKDIENRDWPTRLTGRVLIHAGQKRDEYGYDFLAFHMGISIPCGAIQTGGIIGSVEIVNCTQHSTSKWFFGKYGFVLRNPVALSFVPCRGRLCFFDVTGVLE